MMMTSSEAVSRHPAPARASA